MVRARWAVYGLAGALALGGTGLIAGAVGPFGGVPEQPIAFPHDLHAGTNQIPCMYCHTTADRSVDAGMPSVQICAGCHIAGGNALFRGDSTGIRQLVRYWNEGVAIPWARIYDIADHAHFPHMRHVAAGLECQECHGPVEEMRILEPAASLQMGWCIECHRASNVRTDCFVCHY